MAKRVIAFLLFSAILLATTPVFADTCLCVGLGSVGCGNGGPGGSKIAIDSVDSSRISSYLINSQALSQFLSQGKAYDSGTGWFCWKGCPQ
ncbi:MAG: hypothetical protein A4E64_00423 [Syntrophorhabdus sp. PtaU1.Bin058]|nr:MAG: hypothetical protein A4E64_00423 [Syntrophorhabdus sp. PtaU1.Bin058]